MPSKPETRLVNRIMPRIRRIAGTWFENIQQVAIRGTPDQLGLISGRFAALEFKYGHGKTTELQQHKLGLIEKAGGIALVVNEKNAEEVIDQFTNIKHCTHCGAALWTKK